jgi:hypothetical protein
MMSRQDSSEEPVPERRRKPRREQDEYRERAESWTAALFAHKLLPIVLAVVTTGFFTSVGNRIMWPRDDIKALDAKFTTKDSVLTARVVRIEDRQQQVIERLQVIEENGRTIKLLLCQSLRATNPGLALDGCGARQ